MFTGTTGVGKVRVCGHMQELFKITSNNLWVQRFDLAPEMSHLYIVTLSSLSRIKRSIPILD